MHRCSYTLHFSLCSWCFLHLCEILKSERFHQNDRRSNESYLLAQNDRRVRKKYSDRIHSFHFQHSFVALFYDTTAYLGFLLLFLCPCFRSRLLENAVENLFHGLVCSKTKFQFHLQELFRITFQKRIQCIVKNSSKVFHSEITRLNRTNTLG